MKYVNKIIQSLFVIISSLSVMCENNKFYHYRIYLYIRNIENQ